MNISEAIAKRESVRAYLDKPVLIDDLDKIVEAGRWAPNAGPFQISVIRNEPIRKKINDQALDAMLHCGNEYFEQRASLPGYQPLYGAPVLILLSGPDDPSHNDFGAFDVALAAENMILQATDLGLGSCFNLTPILVLNGKDNQDLVKEIGLPDGYTVKCAVIVGYAASENKFALGERKRKGSVNFVD